MGIVAPGIAVIIPVKNGASRLRSLTEHIREVAGEKPGTVMNVVFADDGSSDSSWAAICGLSAEYREDCFRVRGIRLAVSRGQQSALIAALTHCRNCRVVTMDDDLSHPPSVIHLLLERLEQGIDIVYAAPPRRPGGVYRGLLSRLHQLHMALITGAPAALRVGSFRAMSPALVNRVLDASMTFPYLSAQILTLRPRPRAVMLSTEPWPGGNRSRFSIPELIKLEWNIARHYGPAARFLRRGGLTTAFKRAGGWICEETS
jgi:dolichol-phosphate mannosyltransferase